MGDDYQLVGGVFNVDVGVARQFARDLELDPARTYPDVDALVAWLRSLKPVRNKVER